MKKIALFILFSLGLSAGIAQGNIDHNQIKEDLYEIINDISIYYAYRQDKNIDLKCLLDYYEGQIPTITTEDETVLFFEYLLDEFYDSHVMLNTNRKSSYRLYSPIYSKMINDKFIISNIWQTQIENLEENLIGCEIIEMNGIDINELIENFPTHCNDKTATKVREWIANKIIAGRYNEPRVVTLKKEQGETLEIDLDELRVQQETALITSRIEDGIGVIRLNNSLGNNALINEFDKVLEQVMDTKGLIIDLRNTVDGGNSYVARGIMGRFITEPLPYQKHQVLENYNGENIIERSWIEYVTPRGQPYLKPVAILVGRWTGSMGEGLAIGFEGMGRGEVVGSEMQKLAGEMNGFSFRHQNYGYRLSVAKLYHVNGTPREEYIPTNYVKQSTIKRDELLERAIEVVNK